MASFYDRMEEEEEQEQFVPDQEASRRGGPQTDEEDEAKRKQEERERKKAEVRKRLEEAGRAKKAKKGFLTPERKKKLRKLLMMKAAEDLKQQQLLKEKERQRILQERIMPLPNVDSMTNQADLQKVANDMHRRVAELEEEKYNLEFSVRQKDFEINELNIQVNDLRGKFVKPTLKKVSKYDNKFSKMKAAAAEEKKQTDFRSGLKQTAKEVDIEALALKKKDEKKPEWAAAVKGKGVKEVEAEA